MRTPPPGWSRPRKKPARASARATAAGRRRSRCRAVRRRARAAGAMQPWLPYCRELARATNSARASVCPPVPSIRTARAVARQFPDADLRVARQAAPARLRSANVSRDPRVEADAGDVEEQLRRSPRRRRCAAAGRAPANASAAGGSSGTPRSRARPLPDPAGTIASAHVSERQRARHLVHRAVAAPGHDELDAAGAGLAASPRWRGRARRDHDRGVEPAVAEHAPRQLHLGRPAGSARRPRDGIDDDERPLHGARPRSTRGGRNQRSAPGPPGMARSTSMRQTAPFLNSMAPLAPSSVRRQLAEVRFVADERRDAMAPRVGAACLAMAARASAGSAAGRQRVGRRPGAALA